MIFSSAMVGKWNEWPWMLKRRNAICKGRYGGVIFSKGFLLTQPVFHNWKALHLSGIASIQLACNNTHNAQNTTELLGTHIRPRYILSPQWIFVKLNWVRWTNKFLELHIFLLNCYQNFFVNWITLKVKKIHYMHCFQIVKIKKKKLQKIFHNTYLKCI